MNPNRIIARAMGVSSNDDDVHLADYVSWCVREHPDSVVIIAASRATTPDIGRHQKLRGDRQSREGWCVVKSDEHPGAIIILRKENLNG